MSVPWDVKCALHIRDRWAKKYACRLKMPAYVLKHLSGASLSWCNPAHALSLSLTQEESNCSELRSIWRYVRECICSPLRRRPVAMPWPSFPIQPHETVGLGSKTVRPSGAESFVSPQSHDCGPIEVMECSMETLRLQRLRGHMTAAPLKL